MGYNITMGVVTSLNFTYEVSTLGVVIGGLHYIYIAVSPIYDEIYHMENYYLSCNILDIQLEIMIRLPMHQIAAHVHKPQF